MSEADRLQFQKYFVVEVVILQTGISRVSTETIYCHTWFTKFLFNTELAMHFRAIFRYGCFQQICERRETLLLCFGPYHSWWKQSRTRVADVFSLIYCMNEKNELSHRTDYMLMRINYMFKCSLGLLENNSSHLHLFLRHLRWPGACSAAALTLVISQKLHTW